MNNRAVFEYLLELTQESGMELIKIYREKPDTQTRLVFPQKRHLVTQTSSNIPRCKHLRISEQEFRFALINMLEKHPVPGVTYSVESPTSAIYAFSNKGKRSASTDLSLYYDGKKVINIEFKAHNPSLPFLEKDIEKLIKEPNCGSWLHIFENENSKTIERLFEKFCSAFKKFNCKIKHPISFHILVLKPGILISRKGQEADVNNFNPGNIFDIRHFNWFNLGVGKHLIGNGWQVDKFDL